MKNNTQFSFDAKEHSHYRYNTPLTPPESPKARRALAPGTCVKTTVDGKTVCGVVHLNSTEGCAVIGHGWSDSDEEKFVWRGDPQAFGIWSID